MGTEDEGMPDTAVLVVDDNESFRDAIGAVLGQQGIPVRYAADQQEALARLEAELSGIGLVLVDHHMPGGSGADLLSAMARDPRLARLPVVIMSGDVALVTQRPVLRKPFDATALLSAIRKHRR